VLEISFNIILLCILSCVLVTETGFGLVIGFINRVQLVTTNNYNTVPFLHSSQSLHYNLLSLFSLVFTIRFLATDLNTGIITDSHFKYHSTKSLLITINTAPPLFQHFMVHCYAHTSPLLVTQLKAQELGLQITPNSTHEESLRLTLKVFNSTIRSSSTTNLPQLSATENSPITTPERASVSPRNP
jgi:hypothetical protein